MKPNNPKFFETAEFKKLEATWKAKLKDSGFDDLEDESGDLKKPLRVTNAKFRDQVATRDYYDLAAEALHTFAFENETQRMVWELHCNGMGLRGIGKHFSKSKDWAWKIVVPIQKALGIWHQRPELPGSLSPAHLTPEIYASNEVEDALIEKIDADKAKTRRIKLPGVRITDRIKPKN